MGASPHKPRAGAAAWRQWRPSLFQSMLGVSVLVHALLLTIRFVDPERFNRIFQDTPLEVVLVNAKSDELPVKAQAIAQANLAGGGEASSGRATSPLPPSTVDRPGQDADDAQQRIREMQEAQQQLLAQLRRDLARLPPPDPKKAPVTPEEAQREERRRQMMRMLAEIERRIHEENARPKKRYISPAVREEAYARYYDQLRRRIEERGTRDFPEHQGRKLYGELTMRFTVDADGRVIDVDVVQPSKSRLLNRRAVAIVQAAGPYGPFNDAMRRQADQIVVTSQFRFTRTEGLETTLSAPQ